MNDPINVAIPNTAVEKMAAIVAISHAIENVSKALISVQIAVNIENNTITGAVTGHEDSLRSLININIEDKL